MLPILYQNHDFILFSYPLLMGLGWGIGYQIFFSQLPATLPRWQGQLLFWGSFLFAWLGAKLLFLLTLPDDLSRTLLAQISFWTGGGFVFYGGLFGGVVFLGVYRFLLKQRLDAEVFWPIVPALTIGHAIGRVGCLLAGCCFGKETEAWWGIYLHGAHRHPTQLIEAIGLMVLGVFLLRSRLPVRVLAATYLVTYGILRFGIELLRGDEIRGNWGGMTPSQWISLALLVTGVGLAIQQFRKLRRS